MYQPKVITIPADNVNVFTPAKQETWDVWDERQIRAYRDHRQVLALRTLVFLFFSQPVYASLFHTLVPVARKVTWISLSTSVSKERLDSWFGKRKFESSWNVMAHGDARERKWRGTWLMQWVASTLHTTSEHGLSSITTADAHTSAASSRLNRRPPSRRFKWSG